MKFFYYKKRYMISDENDHRLLIDLIQRMLEYDPERRISLAKALDHEFFDSLPANFRHDDDQRIRRQNHNNYNR